MPKYTTGLLSATENATTYPLHIPLGILRVAERVAATENLTLSDLVNDCLRSAIEEFEERAAMKEQRKRDNETLKRLSKQNGITIIKKNEL